MLVRIVKNIEASCCVV